MTMIGYFMFYSLDGLISKFHLCRIPDTIAYTWKNATKICKSHNFILATNVSGELEDDVVKDLLEKIKDNKKRAWIGGFKQNNKWFWYTDSGIYMVFLLLFL